MKEKIKSMQIKFGKNSRNTTIFRMSKDDSIQIGFELTGTQDNETPFYSHLFNIFSMEEMYQVKEKEERNKKNQKSCGGYRKCQ